MEPLKDFRCQTCKKLLAKYRECQKLIIRCPRCKVDNYLSNQKSDVSLKK